MNLHTDFFYVNKQPFLLTNSSKINFHSVQSGKTRHKGNIISGIKNVIDVYTKRGFIVDTLHGDNEFDLDDLRSAIRPTNLLIRGNNEHDGTIERTIRTVKERCRATVNSAPFLRYPKIMVNALVEGMIYWLNALEKRTESHLH